MIKTLIINKRVKRIEEINTEKLRFTKLVEALRQGGIKAQFSSVETVAEVNDLLVQFKPDLVFSAAYAVHNQHGVRLPIHEVLEQHHIAYIGSDASALGLSYSKAVLKDRWRDAGILTPEYFVVRKSQEGTIQGINLISNANDFPYILKPSQDGNSHEVSQQTIVSDAFSLRSGIFALLSTYDEILVEKYLGSDEHKRIFTVAMIGNKRQKLIMPCEILLERNGGSQAITAADKVKKWAKAIAVDDFALRSNLIDLAEKVFATAEVRDYARFDVLYSGGKLYALEVNGQPMVPDNWFEACSRDAGLNKDQYISAIFLAGIVRNLKNGHPDLNFPEDMFDTLPRDVFWQLI